MIHLEAYCSGSLLRKNTGGDETWCGDLHDEVRSVILAIQRNTSSDEKS